MSNNLLDVHIRHTLHTAHGILPMEVDFSLARGSIMALTGPSGAGKTTLLRLIAGLIHPENGRIAFEGDIWLDTASRVYTPPQIRHIGFVFQDYALFPHMTVRKNLLFALSENQSTQIVDALLEATGLTQLADRKPAQLSGGQQQRVALARALVRRPELLLMDEPFAALDPEMRYQLQDLLLKLHRDHNFTVILVTHDMGEIFRLADRVAIMETGKMTRFGMPSEVYLNETRQEGLLIYGEVLTCKRQGETLTVHAWIDGKIRQLNVPAHFETQMQPGVTFTLRYDAASLDVWTADNRP
ncbi:ABC transporter ATP-binding protein [Dyadobacter sp. CY261]|uniref:ABC transporter ATP-binding protein n=1 Tax=Dyadobacter sp. CY261 TaxID=2907203 RepID=UPI001F3F06EF|nr:ABC transporter ATP-binding protein [Dyadobacter sp. CY261]MCF0073615.1 ABC transporter ATP-binding protein [Dyadobacter sp. CY261]